MIAIWPAGPPKLIKPSLSQNQNASANETCGTTSPAESTLIASDACAVVGIEKFEQLAGFINQAIIVDDEPLGSSQQGLQPACLGYWHPARVKVVDEDADSLE